MDPNIVALILIGSMLLMLSLGIWVALTLTLVGYIGIAAFTGRRPGRSWPPPSGRNRGPGR